MKRFKNMMTIIMASVLVFTLPVTAFASETSFTIHDSVDGYMTISGYDMQVPFGAVDIYLSDSATTVTVYGSDISEEGVDYFPDAVYDSGMLDIGNSYEALKFDIQDKNPETGYYASGNHVTFSNPGVYSVYAGPEGAVSSSVYVVITSPESAAPTTIDLTPVTATPTASKVLVNGTSTSFDAYNINDNNYFKLRDLAYVLNGTEKQFEVIWDSENNAIKLTSGSAYTIVGGEMAAGRSENAEALPSTSIVYIDRVRANLTAYNINNNNYFKLRDIGQAFNFSVTWDSTTGTIAIDTSAGYEDESTAVPTTAATLGITAQTVTASMSEYYNVPEGAFIVSLTPDGPAERAGALEGDIITDFGNEIITSADELLALIKAYAVGETVDMIVYRDGGYIGLEVTLAAA